MFTLLAVLFRKEDFGYFSPEQTNFEKKKTSAILVTCKSDHFSLLFLGSLAFCHDFFDMQ